MQKMNYSMEMKDLIDELIRKEERSWFPLQMLFLVVYAVCIAAPMRSGEELESVMLLAGTGQGIIFVSICRAFLLKILYKKGQFPTSGIQIHLLRNFAIKKKISIEWFDGEITRMLREYKNKVRK